MKYILLTFAIVPIIEIYFLIKVGSYLGALNAISLVFLTALIGLFLIRYQGFQVFDNAKNKILNREAPTEEIFNGMLLALSGIFLVTPGFFTDTLGFFFLVPALRKLVFIMVINFTSFSSFRAHPGNDQNKDWIEGEFKKED